MNDTIEVNLQDLLLAAKQLEEMGDVYLKVIQHLDSLRGLDVFAFEGDDVAEKWAEARDLFWDYVADSQDNLYDTSSTLIHYINAVCEEDEQAAESLKIEIEKFNEDKRRNEEDLDASIDGDDLPEADLRNRKDGVIDTPNHAKADRPST